MKIYLIKNRLRINNLKRLFFLFVTFFFFQVQITQAQHVSLSNSRLTLRNAFTEIERQMEMSVDYNREVIDVNKTVSIPRKEGSLSEIMTALLQGTGCMYVVRDNHIVISKVPVTTQQNRKNVSGTITDQQGIPIIGANIVEKGTTNGTVTDIDGNFTLSVENDAMLFISYIGYLPQEILVRGRNIVDVILQEDTKALEEVVVVGYGTQKKVNLTGAISTVSSEDIVRRQVGQSSMLLQGMAPGVTVKQSSGQPGKDAGSIRIRGIGTLNDANPLILVDGVEMSINNVDPNLIESISVLKDAASSAIYGSRAANGVILITTKRAKTDEFSVSYNSYAGWQTPTDMRKHVDAVDHMVMMNLANTNVGRSPVFSQEQIDNTIKGENRDLYPNTDWQKLIYQGSGFQQSHFVTLNGGSEKIRVLAALGYYDQKGVVENTNYKRYTARFNTDMLLSDRLTAKFDIYGRLMKQEEPASSLSNEHSGILYWLHRMPATQPAILSNGKMGIGWDGDNPYAKIWESGMRRENTPSVAATGSLNYRITDWLQADASYSLHYVPNVTKVFQQAVQTYTPTGSVAYTKPAVNSLSENRTNSLNQDVKAMLTLDKTFGGHTLKVLTGFSQESYNNDWISGYRDNFVFSQYEVLSAGSIENMKNDGSGSEWILRSFYGRANYDYLGKYLFEANLRYDGSSRFASGKQWGVFPSFSTGWRISEEKFWESLRNKVDNLKLRISWGQLGNQLIGNYPFASFLSYGSYVIGGQPVSSAYLSEMANPGISWEKTTMTNAGIDISLFSKLSVNFDYYYKRTSDILLRLDIPRFTGLSAPYQNAGIVDNKGWDLGINFRDNINDFRYDIVFVLSDVQNKVIDLKGVSRTGLTVSNEGYPINSLYGLEAIGYITDADYDANGKYLHATQYGNFNRGDIKYKDQNDDGVIDNKDEKIIGSTIPRYTYSLNLNTSWRGFDLSMFWQGVGKADGYLNQHATMPFYLGGTALEMHKDYWTPENLNASFPRLAFNETNNEKNSTFWMKNAAYLRLKNIQLGYNIPDKVLKNTPFTMLRVYVSGQNLLTFDNFWDGYDVESPVGMGSHYPQVKLYSVGLNVKF